MLANLKPGIRLELYLALLCFLMLVVTVGGGWLVSQRQAFAGDNFFASNPQSAAAVRPGTVSGAVSGDISLQSRPKQPGTPAGDVGRTQPPAQPPARWQLSY